VPEKKRCVVVILTFNSAAIIGETIAQARKVSADVLIVDSGSTDATRDIAAGSDCIVVQHPFSNYSDQRNWAISQVSDEFDWQLHLDADEVLDDVAVDQIRAAIVSDRHQAFMLRRRDYFMGRALKHSGVNPWHLRLFRSGVGHCENRLYDQHFYASVPPAKLRGWMHDKNALSLTDWTARHNRWSDLEAQEVGAGGRAGDDVLKARALGDARERTRFLKQLYYRALPSGMRSVFYFIYRYFFRLGLLDGRQGFYFAFFQALWFRMLVDAKAYEAQQLRNGSR
jgi:glycosyltransferase involved in cell wall biosynthesis